MRAGSQERGRAPLPFGTAVLANVAGSGVTMFLGLVTSTILARLLGPVGRGEYAAILNWPSVIMSAGLLGAPTATVYFVAKDPGAARSWQAHATIVAAAGVLVFTLASWFLMPIVLGAQSPAVIQGARIYSGAFGAANALWFVGVSRLQGQRLFHLLNVLRVTQTATWVVVLLVCWSAGVATPSVLALLFAATFLVLGPVSLRLGTPPARGRVTLDGITTVMTYGIPAVTSTLPQQLRSRLDQLMLASFAPPEVLGLYAVAATLALPVGVLTAPVANVLMPSLAGSHATADRARLLGQTMRVSILAFAAVAFAAVVAAPIAIIFLFGMEYSGAIKPVLLLVPAAAVMGLTTILEDALLGLGRPAAVIKSALAGVIAGGLILAMTLRSWPLVGGAVSAIGGAATSLFVSLHAASRELRVSMKELAVPRAADRDRLVGVVRTWARRRRGQP